MDEVEFREALIGRRESLKRQLDGIDVMLNDLPSSSPISIPTESSSDPSPNGRSSLPEENVSTKPIGPQDAVIRQLEHQPDKIWEATSLRDGLKKMINDGEAYSKSTPLAAVHNVLIRLERNGIVKKTKGGRYRYRKEEVAPSIE